MNAPPQPAPQGSWSTITAALERTVGAGRPAGSWTRYCCPVHEGDGRGHKPSLGVKYDEAAQRTVVRCFAGCENELVLDSLGLQVRDMFDRRLKLTSERTPGHQQHPGRAPGRDRRANRPRPKQLSPVEKALQAAGLPPVQAKKPDLGRQVSPWREITTYPYVRADGTVAGEVVRREAQFERGRDKEFKQRYWDRSTGRMRPGALAPIPYRLPQVLDAVAEGRTIYVCEGEKDVAAAESAGLTATTNCGGAVVWSAQHAKWLRGAATVVVVVDRDTAGYRRAEKVMATLDGLVDRVRVVQAATGKDLHDHLQLGHEIAELDPVPHLDPYTTPSAAAAPDPGAAASSTPGGTSEMLAPESHDTPVDTTADIDTAGRQMAMFWQLMVQQLLAYAQKLAEQRRRDNEEIARREAADAADAAERLATERKTAEAKLAALRKQGWDKVSREELAEAIVEARAWAPDSKAAGESFRELRTHLRERYGLHIDPRTEKVDIAPDAAGLVANLTEFERGRAADARLDTARDRMLTEVAALADLDESAKQALYADINAWKTNPTVRQLDALAGKLAAAKVPEQVRTRIRFTAVYLYDAGAQLTADEQVERGWRAPTTRATHLLRQTDTPLVDPGEEAKPRIDALLVSYQDRLRTGADTTQVREKLSRAVALLTGEDREAARQRGSDIRKNPAGEFSALWPKHVDRDALTVTVATYAALRPQADRAAVAAEDYSAEDAVGLRKLADKQRAVILTAVREGEGLHPLERDQLTAVVRDIDAGREVPPVMLFVDDRSAAQLDADHAEQTASETSQITRRHLDRILSTGRVDPIAVRTTRDEVTRVMDAQTALAAGRENLADYADSGVEERLGAALRAAGVPEPIRNQVRNHLDEAATEAAISGKQANRIRDRWLDRTDAHIADRALWPETPAYDSPQRREGLEANLRVAGLDDDQIAQRMAADAGHAKPPSAAAAAGLNRNRRTPPGAGASAHHRRNRGRGNGPAQGLGL